MAPKGGRGGGGGSGGGGGGGRSYGGGSYGGGSYGGGIYGGGYYGGGTAMTQKKQSIFLHNVIGLITLGYLFAVLGELVYSPLIFPALVFNHVGPVLAWLFALEPSRHIMNLQSSNPSFEKSSILNIKQYFHSGGVGYALLSAQSYAFIYTISAIVYVACISTNGYSKSLTRLSYFFYFGTWYYFIMWFCLVCFAHRSFILRVKSLYYYGFFLLCGTISVTVLYLTNDTWLSKRDRMIFNFILNDVTLLCAVVIALMKGTKWFNIIKFDLIPNQQSV
ncbi:unnamed protein product [Cunninghamella echinulata]